LAFFEVHETHQPLIFFATSNAFFPYVKITPPTAKAPPPTLGTGAWHRRGNKGNEFSKNPPASTFIKLIEWISNQNVPGSNEESAEID
jgi:hypothetical protein